MALKIPAPSFWIVEWICFTICVIHLEKLVVQVYPRNVEDRWGQYCFVENSRRYVVRILREIFLHIFDSDI
jgi:hypothetical protein